MFNFEEELLKMNIKVNELQKKQLKSYFELIVEYNKVMNLTGITEKNDVYLKHFYDSLTICKVIDLNKCKNLCDIGSGAGFPGIVLKIFFPELKITLLDSLNKRIKFLNVVIDKLELKGIEAISIRAEEYSRENKNRYDVVTARAVAHLSILLEYSIPMLKIDGYFIGMKANADTEIEESTNSIKILNSKLDKVEKFLLPIENSNRCLIKVIKEEMTDKKYPRENCEIKKNRL